MILYSLVKERIEARKRQREVFKEIQGRVSSEIRGRELERREWLQWDARRQAAEAAGRVFTEPNPVEKRNGEAHGRELERREWLQWDARRKAVVAAGERFTEPNPAEKRNGATESD